MYTDIYIHILIYTHTAVFMHIFTNIGRAYMHCVVCARSLVEAIYRSNFYYLFATVH